MSYAHLSSAHFEELARNVCAEVMSEIKFVEKTNLISRLAERRRRSNLVHDSEDGAMASSTRSTTMPAEACKVVILRPRRECTGVRSRSCKQEPLNVKREPDLASQTAVCWARAQPVDVPSLSTSDEPVPCKAETALRSSASCSGCKCVIKTEDGIPSSECKAARPVKMPRLRDRAATSCSWDPYL